MSIANIPNMPLSQATAIFNREWLSVWIDTTMTDYSSDVDSWCSFVGLDF